MVFFIFLPVFEFIKLREFNNTTCLARAPGCYDIFLSKFR